MNELFKLHAAILWTSMAFAIYWTSLYFWPQDSPDQSRPRTLLAVPLLTMSFLFVMFVLGKLLLV